MSEKLITCENVGKKFCRDLKKSMWYGVTDSLAEIFGKRQSTATNKLGNQSMEDSYDLRAGEFWANRNITFEVKRGECIGLIGRNGAGKTTLLKMLSGLIKPDTGRIELRGRLGAMIALGAGFNPILTARENIVVNAAILGLSRQQVADRLDEIIEFTELGASIDAPVRTFSSGMQVRLGFGIAAILLKPDILLLDEVLAVGDASFRFKCSNVIARLQREAALILVTHNMSHASAIATHVICLKQGTIVGRDTEAIAEYLSQSERTALPEIAIHTQVSNVHIKVPGRISFGEALHVEICIACRTSFPSVSFRVAFHNEEGVKIAEFDSSLNANAAWALRTGDNTISLTVPPISLGEGKYLLSLICHSENHLTQLFFSSQQHLLTVGNAPAAGAYTVLGFDSPATPQ